MNVYENEYEAYDALRKEAKARRIKLTTMAAELYPDLTDRAAYQRFNNCTTENGREVFSLTEVANLCNYLFQRGMETSIAYAPLYFFEAACRHQGSTRVTKEQRLKMLDEKMRAAHLALESYQHEYQQVVESPHLSRFSIKRKGLLSRIARLIK